MKYIKKTLGIVAIPVICLLIMSAVCRFSGTALFTGFSTVQLYFRGLAYVLLLSLGVSINLHTGRFDFSTGAVMLIGGIVGAKIGYMSGGGPVAMILSAAVVGAVTGGVVGLLYVLLRLPPMIIGLGMTLIIEGIIAIITDGCKPVGFGADDSYYRFAVNPTAMIIICAAALLLMITLFHFTKFGYDYRALQTGQGIAVNAGVNEKSNAVICYTVAGLLFGAAGAISVCNKQIAVLMGCVAYEFIQIGVGQISSVKAFFTSDVYKVVEAAVLVLFLIYLNNEDLILRKRKNYA